MKEMTKYNRVAGYLNKLYDMLNADLFNGEMERPVITIQSTPKAYGHFSLYNAWRVNGQGVPEINIGAGTLDRPIECIITTLLHEMIHQYNAINDIQDCSRNGTYHNKRFKEAAEVRGLDITKSVKYGWCITQPGDSLLDWVLDNQIPEIELNRNETDYLIIDGDTTTTAPPRRSSYRRYKCPRCGLTARTTREAILVCGDCMEGMIREGL
jgi:hypothetical protein